jgi:hypothetical protein
MRTGRWEGARVPARPIHRSTWKENSPKFAENFPIITLLRVASTFGRVTSYL